MGWTPQGEPWVWVVKNKVFFHGSSMKWTIWPWVKHMEGRCKKVKHRFQWWELTFHIFFNLRLQYKVTLFCSKINSTHMGQKTTFHLLNRIMWNTLHMIIIFICGFMYIDFSFQTFYRKIHFCKKKNSVNNVEFVPKPVLHVFIFCVL